jgi:hypothetical protein
MKHSALLIAVLLCTPAMAADDPVLNLLADYVTYCIPGGAIPSADRPLVIEAIQEAVGEKALEQAGRKMFKNSHADDGREKASMARTASWRAMITVAGLRRQDGEVGPADTPNIICRRPRAHARRSRLSGVTAARVGP